MSATKPARNVLICLAAACAILAATTASAQLPPELHDNFIPWGDQPIYDGLSYMASQDVPNGMSWAADDAEFLVDVVVVGVQWAGIRNAAHEYEANVVVLTEAAGVFTEVATFGPLPYQVLEDLGGEFGYDAILGYVELDTPLALGPGHYYFGVQLVSSGSSAFAALLTTGGNLDPGGTGTFYPAQGAVFVDGTSSPDGEWHTWTDYWLEKVGFVVPETDFAYVIHGDYDCDSNGIADYQDIADCAGDPACGDCDGNGVPDGCEYDLTDCDTNGLADECEIAMDPLLDCDSNGILDSCDIASCAGEPWCGDCDGDGRPDVCDYDLTDCNTNGLSDQCEIAVDPLLDCDTNGILDTCDIADCAGEPWCGDCDTNGIPDVCEYDLTDCNTNGLADECEVGLGLVPDCNTNGIPDECDIDGETSQDCDSDGIPDECEVDTDGDGIIDDCDAYPEDFDNDGIPDGCDIDLHPEALDCNSNGITDACDLALPSDLLGAPRWDTELHWVDPDTGGLTLAVDFEYGSTFGIAFSPGGVLYALVSEEGGFGLVTVDLATGETTLVGTFDWSYWISDIAFTGDGTLYGVSGNDADDPGRIVTISTLDASLTPTDMYGSTGSGQSIAGKRGTSLLYHVSATGSGDGLDADRLEVIDVSTGEITVISDSMMRRYQALTWDPRQNRLLGSSHCSLFAIDPATGAETFIGSSGTTLAGLWHRQRGLQHERHPRRVRHHRRDQRRLRLRRRAGRVRAGHRRGRHHR